MVDQRGAEDPAVQRAITQLIAISRIDLVVLVLIVIDMVIKPGT